LQAFNIHRISVLLHANLLFRDIIFTGQSRGSDELARTVKQNQPLLVREKKSIQKMKKNNCLFGFVFLPFFQHIFGHNHEGYGATYEGLTCYINAATALGGAKSVARRSAIIVEIVPEIFVEMRKKIEKRKGHEKENEKKGFWDRFS
jgi:hypothetical protein